MSPAPKLRLAVAAVLFLGWIGWLLYLVLQTRDPVILSRPQFLVANLWVIADVKGEEGAPSSRVTIRQVVWSSLNPPPDLATAEITVSNLPKAKGWAGPGEYILPLSVRTIAKEFVYQVTALPPSPGFPSSDDVRIYPATPQALEELENMPKRAE